VRKPLFTQTLSWASGGSGNSPLAENSLSGCAVNARNYRS